MLRQPGWWASSSISICKLTTLYPGRLVPNNADQGREEYIESELARRHAADKAAQESSESQQHPSSSIAAPGSGTDPTKHGERPTMQGRLQEVDLGDEVRMRNAAMTEQARRRLAGEAVMDDEEGGGARKRPRVGKDGKPWRGRKRRASDDVKRDQMVEALMRENRRKSGPLCIRNYAPMLCLDCC